MNQKKFQAQVKAARKVLGVTRTGAVLNVTEQTIRNWSTGAFSPNPTMRKAYSATLAACMAAWDTVGAVPLVRDLESLDGILADWASLVKTPAA